jgi:uncharacterized protein involved in outer membrane biogenesis
MAGRCGEVSNGSLTSKENIMKKVFIGLAVIAIILGALLWWLGANLDGIVKKVIEDVGTDVTQTSVDVSGVGIKLLDGKAAISELSVANPPGFSEPNVFTLDKVSIEIDIKSLNSNPIIINEILVRQPQVFYEMNKDQTSNLDVLKKNVAGYSASGSSSSPDVDKEAATDAKGEELKLIIKKLNFEGGHLSAVSALAPDKKIEADIPAFHMNNLGQSTGGATSAQIAKQIMDRLIKQAVDVAAKAGVDQLTDELKQKGQKALDEKVGDTLKGLFN